MRKIQWNRRKTAAVATVVALALTGGIAFAFWTANGTGSGSATTATPVGLTVVQTSTNTGLQPGTSTALTGTITNTNTSPATVTALTANVTAFSLQGNPAKPACTQADFTITGTATVASPVPASSTTGGAWSGLTLNMVNSTTLNQDNCKNVTVPITYASN